jgi:hypothetical protein
VEGDVRRRLAFLALIALFAAPSGTGAAGVASDSYAWSEAVRFRSELGLSTDPVLIDSLLASQAAEDWPFGTPLTAAEESLMQRRGAIQRELQPLRDYALEHADALAGIWLSYPPGGTVDSALTVNVNVAQNLNAHGEQIRTLVPDGATLELHSVRFAASELATVKSQMRDEWDQYSQLVGAQLQATATNVPGNFVDVYVAPLTDDVVAAIEGRYPPGTVRVSTLDGIGLDACTRTNCGPPWTGGVKIYNTTGGNFCSLGFVVRKSTSSGYVYGAWTAGHCGSATWRQGSSTGSQIGKTILNRKNIQPYDYADIQVIEVASTTRNNKIIDDTASCPDPCTRRAFTGSAQQGYNGDEFGDTVCNNGYRTGKTCGTIRDTDLHQYPYDDFGLILYNQRRATYARQPGDSGGPIYTTVGSVAAGSHVHYIDIGGTRYPVYSHVFELSVETGYYVYNGS